ncbi:MAG: S-layer homology domain-containing protein [Oscillospiraceae bacterium]|jgi:hypothetical protein|nr:S-layer homology domain-containing protein [Oscillospiraceae bacterium]
MQKYKSRTIKFLALLLAISILAPSVLTTRVSALRPTVTTTQTLGGQSRYAAPAEGVDLFALRDLTIYLGTVPQGTALSVSHTYTWSNESVSARVEGITVNGEWYAEAFLDPALLSETDPLPAKSARSARDVNRIIDYMRAMGSISYTLDRDIYYYSDLEYHGQTAQYYYPAGMHIKGILYTWNSKRSTTNLETFPASNGKYTGAAEAWAYSGNDCSSAVIHAWRQVVPGFPMGNSTTLRTYSGGFAQTYAVSSLSSGFELEPGDVIVSSHSQRHVIMIAAVDKENNTFTYVDQHGARDNITTMTGTYNPDIAYSSWGLDRFHSYNDLNSNAISGGPYTVIVRLNNLDYSNAPSPKDPKPKPTPHDGTKTADWDTPLLDVTEDKWYFGDVRFVIENGFFSGTSETTFSPDGIMSRGMVATVLWRISGKRAISGLSSFTDVASDAYYAVPIAWAQQNNIVRGVSDDRFDPDGNITREQFAAIIYKYATEYLGIEYGGSLPQLNFTDNAKISGYAQTAVRWCVANRIISGVANGDGTVSFQPQENATRAQVAAMLHRFTQITAES